MATKSQTRTANLLRLSFDQVHGVMCQSVARGLKWRSAIKMYPHLSIDEKSIHKNHNYVSILTDQDTGMVIEVESGRTDDSVESLCTNGLNETQRANVMTVCTDMWNPFIKGVKKVHPKNAYLPFQIYMDLYIYDKRILFIFNKNATDPCMIKYKQNKMPQIRTFSFQQMAYSLISQHIDFYQQDNRFFNLLIFSHVFQVRILRMNRKKAFCSCPAMSRQLSFGVLPK